MCSRCVCVLGVCVLGVCVLGVCVCVCVCVYSLGKKTNFWVKDDLELWIIWRSTRQKG